MIGAKTAYHDYGEWTPEGFRVGRTVDPFTGKPNPLFFPADAGLLAAPSGSFDGAVYGWSVSLESAATIITAIALQRTGRTDYVMPAVAFIVGAHFFRLARAMIGGGGQLFVWVGALIWDKARISKPFSLRE